MHDTHTAFSRSSGRPAAMDPSSLLWCGQFVTTVAGAVYPQRGVLSTPKYLPVATAPSPTSRRATASTLNALCARPLIRIRRRLVKGVKIIQVLGTRGKNVMYPNVLVTDSLIQDGMLSIGAQTGARTPLGAGGPLPVRTVKPPETPCQPTLSVSGEDVTDFYPGGQLQVTGEKLAHHMLREELHRTRYMSTGEPRVLVRAIAQLPIPKPPVRRNKLLKRLCFWPPGRVHAL